MTTRAKFKEIASLERSNSHKSRMVKRTNQQSQSKIQIQLGGPTKNPESTLSFITRNEVGGLNKY